MNPVLKRVITGLTIGASVTAAILFVPTKWFYPATALLGLLALIEYALLFRRKVPHPTALQGLYFLLGGVLLGGGLLAIPVIAVRYGNLMIFYILALVKFSDTGGFAFGLTTARFMKGGNHKMCPTISPNKSWEGLLGSVVFALIVSLIAMPLSEFPLWKAALFAVVAALVGTAGDLIESKFKRWVGVKDSSALKITNGMGGILDMIDSLLLAPAALLILLEVLP